MNFFEALEHIEKRPRMYFDGGVSLALLDAFMFGFLTGTEEKRIVGKNSFDLEYFNNWLIGSIPNALPANQGWRRQIEHVAGSDEEGVQMFFDLARKFSNGVLTIENQETEPKVLKWSLGRGAMKLEDFQEIEETIVRYEIVSHEFSKTKFRFGYNENNFRVYVEAYIGDKTLDVRMFTEIEEK